MARNSMFDGLSPEEQAYAYQQAGMMPPGAPMPQQPSDWSRMYAQNVDGPTQVMSDAAPMTEDGPAPPMMQQSVNDSSGGQQTPPAGTLESRAGTTDSSGGVGVADDRMQSVVAPMKSTDASLSSPPVTPDGDTADGPTGPPVFASQPSSPPRMVQISSAGFQPQHRQTEVGMNPLSESTRGDYAASQGMRQKAAIDTGEATAAGETARGDVAGKQASLQQAHETAMAGALQRQAESYDTEMTKLRSLTAAADRDPAAAYFKDAGPMARIGAIIGGILGGYNAPFQGGRNTFIEGLQHDIDRKFDAAQKGVTHQQGLIADLRTQFGSDAAARNALQLVGMQRLESELKKSLAGPMSDLARANGMKELGSIGHEIAELNRKLEEQVQNRVKYTEAYQPAQYAQVGGSPGRGPMPTRHGFEEHLEKYYEKLKDQKITERRNFVDGMSRLTDFYGQQEIPGLGKLSEMKPGWMQDQRVQDVIQKRDAALNAFFIKSSGSAFSKAQQEMMTNVVNGPNGWNSHGFQNFMTDYNRDLTSDLNTINGTTAPDVVDWAQGRGVASQPITEQESRAKYIKPPK